MIRKIHYSIFEETPEITCLTAWLSKNSYSKPLDSGERSWGAEAVLKEMRINPDSVARAQQIHGSRLRVVAGSETVAHCDGLVSAQQGLYLQIRTADCAAVMMYDVHKKIIANLHIGWRGGREKIVIKAIRFLQKYFDSNTKHLVAAISPCIRSCCYVVSHEFSHYFSQKYLCKSGNKLYFDLPAVIGDQLLQSGITASQVEWNSQCTYCSSYNFPSYRRDATGDRLLNLIKLEVN